MNSDFEATVVSDESKLFDKNDLEIYTGFFKAPKKKFDVCRENGNITPL